jgi:RNA polymerase sigma factor (sigma-70 family)
MLDKTSLESVFLDNLGLIDRVAACLARRHGLSGDDASDFSSWIKLKLVEDGYAIFRSFRGESSIGTYLTVVIAMLARDFRAQRWGRWRPSAAARRHGPVAIRLETLVYRHGYRVDQAGEVLRTAGETTLSDRELGKLLAALPVRAPLRPVEVGPDPLGQVESMASADGILVSEDIEHERRHAEQTLVAALGDLSLEDRLIVRMRFWDGLGVADIARGLRIDQKPLYRRLERLLGTLRQRLLAAGVDRDRIASLLTEGE